MAPTPHGGWGNLLVSIWISVCDLTVVYQDFGISEGMKLGLRVSEHFGVPIEYRNLADVVDLEAEIKRISEIEQIITQGVKF